jgi:hypothetical protein
VDLAEGTNVILAVAGNDRIDPANGYGSLQPHGRVPKCGKCFLLLDYPERKFLMDYISRFVGRITKKGNFDGLHKQVFVLQKSRKIQKKIQITKKGNLMAHISSIYCAKNSKKKAEKIPKIIKKCRKIQINLGKAE